MVGSPYGGDIFGSETQADPGLVERKTVNLTDILLKKFYVIVCQKEADQSA